MRNPTADAGAIYEDFAKLEQWFTAESNRILYPPK